MDKVGELDLRQQGLLTDTALYIYLKISLLCSKFSF